MLEIQTEFQLQVKTLKRELEDEKQARIKLEAEVTFKNYLNRKIFSNTNHVYLGQSFEKDGEQNLSQG